MADYSDQPPPYTDGKTDAFVQQKQQQGAVNPHHVGYDQPPQQPQQPGNPPQQGGPNPLYNAGNGAGYNQQGDRPIPTAQYGPPYAPQYGQQYGQQPYPTIQQPTTNINVTQIQAGAPTIFMTPYQRDQTCTAVFACLCCFWPTGIVAIYYASRAQDEYSAGNYLESNRSNDLARRWIIASFILPWIVGGILAAILATTLNTYSSSTYNEYNG